MLMEEIEFQALYHSFPYWISIKSKLILFDVTKLAAYLVLSQSHSIDLRFQLHLKSKHMDFEDKSSE